MRGTLALLRGVGGEGTRALVSGARVVMVYIHEAHAQDEWPVSSAKFLEEGAEPVCMVAARSDAARVARAQSLAARFEFDVRDVYVDRVEGEEADGFGRRFDSWPMRAYLFRRGEPRPVATSEPEGADVGLWAFMDTVREHVEGGK